jgi:hypothetical protein
LLHASDGIGWFSLASSTPITKLSHVNPAIAGLAVKHPGLWTLEDLANLSLREAYLLPQFSKESWDLRVTPFVLGFGQHKQLIFYPEFA